MSKKVLLISSSPRRGGNSELLCDQFMAGAQEAGNEAEKIVLSEKRIGYCRACNSCRRNGGSCVQTDDAAEIVDKMIAADVIVMATPVYFYSMSAQMKTLIDRTYPKYTQISDKAFCFIVTAADNREQSMNRVVGGLRGFTACLPNSTEAGVVYGVGAWAAGDIKASDAMTKAFEMGKQV